MTDWTSICQRHLSDRPDSVSAPTVKLPILSRAVTEFSQKAEDPDANARDLGAIVETDSGLTCGLLRHVNSTAFGLRNKVQSAQQAISVLGIRSAVLIIVSTAIQRAMKARESKLINFQNFWNTNLERALLAREVAKLLKSDPELAYAAALLQDFLLPVVTNELFNDYLAFSVQQDKTPIDLIEFERKRFRWDHSEAAAQVLFHWGFPDDLICCVLFHHRGLELLDDDECGGTAAAAVAVAGLMPDAFRQVPLGLKRLIELEARWPEFDLETIAQRVETQFLEVSPENNNYYSLWHRYRKAMQLT